MYIDQNEPGWNTLRFDSRTYTFQDTKKEKEQCGVIPPEYVFVDDKCFMGNGKIKEVILPPKCRIIGRMPVPQIRTIPEYIKRDQKACFCREP